MAEHRYFGYLTILVLAVGSHRTAFAGDANPKQEAAQTLRRALVYVHAHKAEGPAAGSGFLVDRQHKWVVTCYHVVNEGHPVRENAANIAVTFPWYDHGRVLAEKRVYQKYDRPIRAAVVAVDEQRDLAVLELEIVTPQAEAIPLGTADPSVGDPVNLAGNPGRSPKLWEKDAGAVRIIGRKQLHYVRGQRVDTRVLEIDVEEPVLPGYSGGPVVDTAGRLVGVVTGTNRGGRTMFAIDAAAVRDILELLKRRPRDWELLDPRSSSDYSKRGMYYYQRGRRAQAAVDFQEAIQRNPRNAAACRALAWLWATDPQGEPSKAVELARRACDLSVWKSAGMLDTLATAYAACGKFEEAVAAEKRAIELAEPAELPPLQERLLLFQARTSYHPTGG